jgi:GH25 family lysozyme M1 (1,4-beta-N-acetylmuramidase)
MPTKPANSYGRKKHKHDLQAFTADLQSAVNAVIPTYKKPYGQVAVLAFHWSNDAIGVVPLETDLLEIFRETYNFFVESFEIPKANSHNALVSKLAQFSCKWAAKDALRIYIYSGHAEAAGPTSTSYCLG